MTIMNDIEEESYGDEQDSEYGEENLDDEE